ncbi:MAG TPA: RNA polymerase sigma factor [Verrucomicrobiae bacterium]|jgi:RNA polymerase sigma factor (sigma-70 family)
MELLTNDEKEVILIELAESEMAKFVGYAASHLNAENRNGAEDMVFEAFTIYWLKPFIKNASAYAVSAAKSYIYTTIGYLCCNENRLKEYTSRAGSMDRDGDLEIIKIAKMNHSLAKVKDAETLDQEALLEELKPKMITALGKLKPDQAEVIRLLFFEEHSYAEAATMMGISETTLRSIRKSALKALFSNL